MFRLGVSTFLTALISLSFFATIPTSSSYSLKSYDLGGGGGGSLSSSSYKLNGETGTLGGTSSSSSTYSINSGETVTQNSNVPPAPTLTNPSSEYSRLNLVLNTASNPSDTKYAIAISSDNFTTTLFVKSDDSIGSTLVIGDFQTYTAWGGATGFWITGLSPGTSYKVKVKAMQGNFTQTAYGPSTGAVATVQPTISFGVATTISNTPPYTISYSGLSAGSVFNANADAVLTLSTNALYGSSVYIKDTNSGLASILAGTTINSVSTDLSSASSGYGSIVTSTSQVSGGPFTISSPFNGVANNVGALNSSLQTLVKTSSAVNTGSITAQFKAKAASTTPASTDYSDNLTFVAVMLY